VLPLDAVLVKQWKRYGFLLEACVLLEEDGNEHTELFVALSSKLKSVCLRRLSHLLVLSQIVGTVETKPHNLDELGNFDHVEAIVFKLNIGCPLEVVVLI
jgi:hypothetical protein